ncbi:MFS transporter [Streptomyces sp. NBC_00441]|uniref:MFS transporter n=1 Tax=Streptomyces sp. NBC_00441 TaxID=2975742 RepID=UPI002E2B041F|nr:MFS transporter [Streptomyces sp. NBC_00441]
MSATASETGSGKAPGTSGGGGLALTVIAVAQLMVMLDATIVNVALPEVQKDLDLHTTDLSWVVNAYTLAFGGLLLLGGRIGDILGRRRVFLGGIALFTLASLAGGFAQSSAWLMASRALQGVGAAVIAPSILALIVTTFLDEGVRNKAFGVYAAVSGSGAAVGLLAGGALTQALSWRWVLFVNVPIGIALYVVIPKVLRETDRQPGRFDVYGALTSTLGMGALVYAFIRAGDKGWSDGSVLATFAAAAVLLAAFVVIEARIATPIIPLRMFRDRNRAGIYVIGLCLTGSVMGLFFFLTLLMQNAFSYDPLEAGLAFLPVSVSIVFTATVVSKQLPRLGMKLPLVLGVTLNTAALLWLSNVSTATGYLSGLLGPMLLFGIGTGLLFVPLSQLGVAGVPMEDSGAASSLLNATQQVGGSLGLAVLMTVFGSTTRSSTGTDPAAVLTDGASAAFLAAAGFAVLALLIAAVGVKVPAEEPAGGPAQGQAPDATPAQSPA